MQPHPEFFRFENLFDQKLAVMFSQIPNKGSHKGVATRHSEKWLLIFDQLFAQTLYCVKSLYRMTICNKLKLLRKDSVGRGCNLIFNKNFWKISNTAFAPLNVLTQVATFQTSVEPWFIMKILKFLGIHPMYGNFPFSSSDQKLSRVPPYFWFYQEFCGSRGSNCFQLWLGQSVEVKLRRFVLRWTFWSDLSSFQFLRFTKIIKKLGSKIWPKEILDSDWLTLHYCNF